MFRHPPLSLRQGALIMQALAKIGHSRCATNMFGCQNADLVPIQKDSSQETVISLMGMLVGLAPNQFIGRPNSSKRRWVAL